jgi:hypothetical protein
MLFTTSQASTSKSCGIHSDGLCVAEINLQQNGGIGSVAPGSALPRLAPAQEWPPYSWRRRSPARLRLQMSFDLHHAARLPVHAAISYPVIAVTQAGSSTLASRVQRLSNCIVD